MMNNPALYRSGYLPTTAAESLYRVLNDTVAWRTETIRLYGKTIAVPREVAWYGDSGVDYRYSGLSHPAEGWPDVLARLRDQFTEEFAIRFNFVLLNRYLDGQDYMGWHRDDEPGVGTTVASISLGGQRRFLLRENPSDRSIPLDLEHGSLLLFDGSMRHSLPRCVRAAPRINLSFRSLEVAGSEQARNRICR
jgi:alkylated DNA repair dioxygenase AlkB